MVVLDTNVISELMRSSPAAQVVAWLDAQSVPSLFITAITQAEILYGIALLPEGKRQRALASAAMETFAVDFHHRVLAFDGSAASAYAEIATKRQKAGAPISQLDAQIAAIAASHGAAIATRNVADFAGCGVDLINPWSA